MGSLPAHPESANLISLRKLTATLCLTIAVLLGSEVRGSDLPECEGSPLIGVPGDVTSWNDCFGSFQWYGITYRGEWKRGKRHGYGSTIFPNGDKYEGNRSYGLRDGPGIYFYADGRLQEGIWKNGKFQYAQKVSPTITAGKSPPPSSKSAAEKENDRLRKEIARLKKQKQSQPKQVAKKPPSNNPPPPKSGSTGSGFFVSKLGHILTNEHVVRKCGSVTVGDNANKQVAASILETDKRNDLALLSILSTKMASAETKSLISKLNVQKLGLSDVSTCGTD